MPSCLMLAARPSMALRSIFRRGFAVGGSKTDNDTDCNMIDSLRSITARSRDLAAPLPVLSFLWTDGCACTRCLPARAGVASARRLRTRVPSGRRWDALRARGAAPHSDRMKQNDEPKAHALTLRKGS